MSIADDVENMEAELEVLRVENRDLDNEISSHLADIDSLTLDLEELSGFVQYVDKTHPELRTAYEASKKLEGDTV